MFMSRVKLQASAELRHLGSDLRKGLGQEVRRSQARLHDAEMLVGPAAPAFRFWVFVTSVAA
jgi:hypothetical protein